MTESGVPNNGMINFNKMFRLKTDTKFEAITEEDDDSPVNKRKTSKKKSFVNQNKFAILNRSELIQSGQTNFS